MPKPPIEVLLEQYPDNEKLIEILHYVNYHCEWDMVSADGIAKKLLLEKGYGLKGLVDILFDLCIELNSRERE